MKLSIITTVYQAEKDLPRLLDSMMAQKSPELEFFLIDNGCTDSSASICAAYAKKDSRIKIHTIKENIGYIRARNLGLDIVTADYVGFCDSDDYLVPEAYDKVILSLKENNPDLYIGNWNTITENGRILTNTLPAPSGLYSRENRLAEIIPFFWGQSQQGTMIPSFMWKQVFRLKLIKDYNLHFKESLKPCEDMLFNAQYINKCDSVLMGNENVIYNYIVNINSITGKIARHIDIERESRRIMLLYDELGKIAPDTHCRIANANRALLNIVTLISMVARSEIIDKTKQISTFLPREFTSEVCIESAPWKPIFKILRVLIKFRLFTITTFAFRVFHK